MYDQVIKQIDSHAFDNYEKGWDGWIETMGTEEKIEVFNGAKDYDTCYHRVVLWVADYAQSNAIKAEGCALYEVEPDFYKQIQDNDKTCREAAQESKAALEELDRLRYDEEVRAEDALEDPELNIRRSYPL